MCYDVVSYAYNSNFCFDIWRVTNADYLLTYLLTVSGSSSPVSSVDVVVTCYSLRSVMEAFGLTCAVTVALTVYTLQSQKDFSAWGAG